MACSVGVKKMYPRPVLAYLVTLTCAVVRSVVLNVCHAHCDFSAVDSPNNDKHKAAVQQRVKRFMVYVVIIARLTVGGLWAVELDDIRARRRRFKCGLKLDLCAAKLLPAIKHSQKLPSTAGVYN